MKKKDIERQKDEIIRKEANKPKINQYSKTILKEKLKKKITEIILETDKLG